MLNFCTAFYVDMIKNCLSRGLVIINKNLFKVKIYRNIKEDKLALLYLKYMQARFIDKWKKNEEDIFYELGN